jgi:hypothetical protein
MGRISVIDKTDHLFESRELCEMPAPPFVFATSQSESLMAVVVGSDVRFLRFDARERQVKLMEEATGLLSSHIAV